MDDLVATQTPVDHVRHVMPEASETRLRSVVAGFGLTQERMETQAQYLSGGEKARLLLGLCTCHSPELLILDEPTNHLDIGTREALVHAINNYSGAVILISHDRYLIEATMDRLWLVNEGKVIGYDGDLDSYKTMLLQRVTGSPAKNDSSENSKQNQRKKAAALREKQAPLRKQMAEKEMQMEKLTKAITKLDNSLATPGIFENHPEKATKFSKQRAEADKMMEQLEMEWIALGEELESG